jgi:flagellar assembly protein FliH
MTARAEPFEGVLRNVGLHAQPRVLAGPRGDRSQSAEAAGIIGPPAAQRPVLHEVAARPTEAIDAAQAREQGLREGRQEGLQQGLQEARRQIEEATRAASAEAHVAVERQAERRLQAFTVESAERLRQLAAVIEAFESARDAQLALLEPEAVALAFDVVCRVLGNVDERRAIVEAMVAQAFSQLRGTPVRVRMGASDLAWFKASVGAGLVERYPAIEWVADERVAHGGCLLDGPTGTLDARLDTQLQNLLHAWRDSGALGSDAAAGAGQ